MAGQINPNRLNNGAIASWVALAFAVLMLVAGVAFGPGLWDPWEMNHAAVARRMTAASPVLVIDAAGADGGVAKAARSVPGIDLDVVAARGPEALDRFRDSTSDKIFAAVVLDINAIAPADGEGGGDPASVKSLANAVRSVASKNLSTTIILAGTGSGQDARTLRERVLKSADAAADDDRVDGLDRILVAGSTASLAGIVRDAAFSAGLIAQFKSGGRTQYLPPLEPFLTSVWYRIFGINELGSRLTGLLFAAFTLALLFFPGRRVFGDRVIAVTMLVLATSLLFTSTARFVGSGMSEVFAVALGVISFGMVLQGDDGARACRRVAWWVALGLSVVLAWLAGGMTAAVTVAAIIGAWFVVQPKAAHLPAVGMVMVLLGVIALLTFLPDCAWARQFRFTAATFGGGINLESRSFDFIIKEIGFGFFPWSAFLPVALWMAVAGKDRDRPSRLLLVLWAVVPMVVAMLFVRPFNQPLFLGVPALALLTALLATDAVDSMEDSRLRTRLFGFFVAGLFIVMMKDMLKSPAPLVSFLTTDPMFSKPGQGDGGFPTTLRIPAVGKLMLGVMLISILAVTAEMSSMARLVVRFLSRRRNYMIITLCLAVLILVDIGAFIGMKWRVISAGGPRAGSELLRILLTGPDILALYIVTILVGVLHFWDALALLLKKRLGEIRWTTVVGLFDALQSLKVQKVAFGAAAAGFAMVMTLLVNPALTMHLSQKHIVDTWKKGSLADPGKLYRHGSFSTRGSDDSNFYTSGLEEIESRSEVTRMLGDKSRRTFFLLPTRQFSEINSAWRDVTGGRGLPVLDDRSSRIVLATSRLAPGETDRNWLVKATLTVPEFEALKNVDRISVNFEDSLEIVGFQITPQAITRGTNPTLKVFYKVNRKVSKSYRVFMHVDRVGSSTRIHGDHWILNMVPESEDQDDCIGCFATNHWKKGDVIVDTYVLQVPIGSPSGDYDVWMGLYVPGGSRMKVKSWDEQKVRNDGSDRVRIGKMTVR